MAHRRQYTDEALEDAVRRVCSGTSAAMVSSQTRVPLRTLYKYVKIQRSHVLVAPARHGPPPVLTEDGEKHLVEWVIGMQLNGRPATRSEILARASDISSRLHGAVCALFDGWYHRFMRRHPELTNRQAQTILRARNACTEDNLSLLFYTMVRLMIECRLDASRIFNMDETSFVTRPQSTKVVALRGSRNVWSRSISTSFHHSVVVCPSASGFVSPPLFILPGQRVSRNLMDGCSVSCARVTCTASGFINRFVFLRWVEMFSNSVPNTVARPLCSYSTDICPIYLSVRGRCSKQSLKHGTHACANEGASPDLEGGSMA